MKKVGLLVLLLLAAFVVTGYLLPRHVHVERSITVNRPVNMMFELLNGYEYYNQWSPWAERDPLAEFVISGPQKGIGARLSWNGDPRLIGSGWQEIVASTPYERIDIKLDFDAQGVADIGFELIPEGETTHITWFFDSDLTQGVNFLDAFLARYFGLLFDRWVGGDYERGLENLKQYAEALDLSEFNQVKIERVNVTSQDILFVTSSSSQESTDVVQAMTAAYAEISAFMNVTGANMTGQPMAITRAWKEGGYQFDAAIPVDFIPVELTGNIRSGLSPAGPAVRAVFHGAYSQIMPTYEKLAAYMSAHGLRQGGVSWELYVSDPATTAQQDMVTHIYIMLESQELVE